MNEIDRVAKISKKYLSWGLTKNMRAITIGVRDSNQLVFRAYTNDASSIKSDTEALSEMGVYVWSMVSDDFQNQWSECVPTTAPFKDLVNLGVWIYIKESETAS